MGTVEQLLEKASLTVMKSSSALRSCPRDVGGWDDDCIVPVHAVTNSSRDRF